MSKILFFCLALLLGSFGAYAQAQATISQSFIKVAHLGTQGRSIVDLYLTTQVPALDSAQGMSGRYRFESVCLLSEAEFTPLVRYVENYIAKHKSNTQDDKYGTFAITLGGSGQPVRRAVYTRNNSLAFLKGAAEVLQKQAAGPDKSEALRRLEATTRRLGAVPN